MDNISDSSLELAAHILAHAHHVVCLTGAGVSAESGIATFRDAVTGMWTKFDPVRLASQQGFAEDPGYVWQWYMQRLQNADTEPNPGHVALARLEKLMPRFSVITQNVDDLHERAGSTVIYHVHGSIAQFRCNECHRAYVPSQAERDADMPPVCPTCRGLVRPAVVWFGENLPEDVTTLAWQEIEECDALLVVGTSGEVYPVASLPSIAKEHGADVIDVNPDPSEISRMADAYLQGRSGEVLPKLVEQVAHLRGEV